MEEISNFEEPKALEKKVSLKDEILRLKNIENLELDLDVLLSYEEHLGRSDKEYLNADEAVDFYHQFIPFLIREIEKKKIALDNMRLETKNEVSTIFDQSHGRTVPPEIKDILKKLENSGFSGENFDKLKKQLFQRDASGRLVKTLPELYSLIFEFFLFDFDKSKSRTDKLEFDKRAVKQTGFDDISGQSISEDIDERVKRLETCDVDMARLTEFKKKVLRTKPGGGLMYSNKEIYLRLLDFCEQELKRSKARWIKDKKLEATIDSYKTPDKSLTGETPVNAVKAPVEKPSPQSPGTDIFNKVLHPDIVERLKKLEENKINSEEVNNLKVELYKRNSNGNLILAPLEMYGKVTDFYEKVIKDHCKDQDMIAEFKVNNEFSSSIQTQSDISGQETGKDIETIKDELIRLEKLASEYFVRSQRLEMDIKRLKHQKEKAVHEVKNISNEKLLSRLLVVMDDFDRAIKASEEDSSNQKALVEGIELISRRLISVLQREGLKIIDSLGKTFDPTIHEAFEQVQTNDYPEDTVIEVLRSGYWLGDKLLRPSLVKVSKKII